MDNLTKRERKLSDLQKRYAWVGAELSAAHADGKIDSESVRFFITNTQPLLRDEEDAEPVYFGVAQAYSYIGDPPTHTVAGSVNVSLQFLDQVPCATVVDALCADLSILHTRERERFLSR